MKGRVVVAVVVVASMIVGGAGALEVAWSQPRAATADTAGAKVNINAASAKELMTLKGIGETVARRIVQFRETNGPFKSVDDLKRVDGVGGALLERHRPRLVVK
jgi:competence protein ComEA